MKIAVVGGGAIGLLFAHYLNEHHEITLYVRNPMQREKIQSGGVNLQNQEGIHQSNVKVDLVSEWGKNEEELSIICVKQHQLPKLLGEANIKKNHPVLFLQNGMGHLKWIDLYKYSFVLIGSVEHGAFKENENTVIHTGIGRTKIASYKARHTELVQALINPFEYPFSFQYENDYERMLHMKLVVNAIINPLTALLNVPNGALLENPYFLQVLKDLFHEIKRILKLQDEMSYYQNVIQVCKNTRNNRSSMLKDLDENRQTEVDAILGYLLENAKKQNIDAPLVNTLFQLIKGSEFEGGGK